MHSSLSWIEWFDRLDRVLKSARSDVVAVARENSPRAAAAIEQSTRQLAGLLHTLHLLDPNVLVADLQSLQAALDKAIFHLGSAAGLASAPAQVRERMCVAINSALQDVALEAAGLLRPHRRSA